MYNYLADFAQTFGAHRVALPAWLGRALHKAQAAKLAKGASHKYIRKIPTGKTSKTGKPTFRYFYTVGGGAGLGHHSEFVEGAAFRVRDAGKEGHFHIVKTPTDGSQSVTIRHDESGKTSTITRAALRELLHNEHAEPLRQAKERAAATLEQAKKTGTPKQQERARQQAEKVGAKEKGGVGAFEFDKASAADFAGLWSRTLEPSAIRTQAANDYNKHLQSLAQSLHDLAPTDPRAVEAFEEHKEVFDGAFQRWADKAGALAGPGYKRGGVEASVYDTDRMRDQAHKATVELLAAKDDARKAVAKIKNLPKKDDPTLFLKSKLQVTQNKLEKLQRLNEILNASPKGWTPTKMQFIDKLDLDKSDLRDYGRNGVPTKTLNYLKQTIRDLEKKLDLIEEDEKRGVRESKRAAEQQSPPPASSTAAPKTEAEALAHVNDLPLPEIETRGGKGDWRERRHHMGDVSISATGPYATLNDAAKRSLARMWRARRLEDLGHASGPLWAQIKNDDAKNQPPSVTKSLARLFGLSLRAAPLPTWLGSLLYEAQAESLAKGAAHKYIRKVPKAGGGWKYFYKVTGGHGLGHHSEMVVGAAFAVKDAGKAGHFHITEDHGDEVTLKHDESGKSSRVSKQALAAMLHNEHAQAVDAVKQRAAANLEQAKKTGTAKQQEKAAALVSKYAGASEAAGGANAGEMTTQSKQAIFSVDDIIVGPPRTSRTKRARGIDGTVSIEVNVPGYRIDSDDWLKIPHPKRLRARVSARLNFENGKAPNKKDKVWYASSDSKFIGANMTQAEALDAAKAYVMSALDGEVTWAQ